MKHLIVFFVFLYLLIGIYIALSNILRSKRDVTTTEALSLIMFWPFYSINERSNNNRINNDDCGCS